jgi:hypothetical protein
MARNAPPPTQHQALPTERLIELIAQAHAEIYESCEPMS